MKSSRCCGVLRRLLGPTLLVFGGVVFAATLLTSNSLLTPVSRPARVLHFQQTIALARFNGPGSTLDYCQLILAESNKLDKAALLDRLGRSYTVEEVDFNTMLAVVDQCRIQDVEDGIEDDDPGMKDEEYYKFFRGILPGTLWCGYDDLAPTYDSLGPARRLDSCCRAHDHCPLKVKALQNRYGVMNLHPYTKVACECDSSFYNCLKSVGSEKANAVGNFFFNIIQIQCLQKDLSRNCSNLRVPRSFYNFRSTVNEDECRNELFYKPVSRGVKF